MKYFDTTTPRYKIEKTELVANITINSRRNLGSVLFLTLWLFMWLYMLSGVSTVWWYLFISTTKIADPELRGSPLFVIVLFAIAIFLLLLLFLGFLGIYAFLWELSGKEYITVDKEKMMVIRQLFGWKRTREFLNKKIDGIITRDTKQSLFWIPFQQRYRYAFELNYDKKAHRFGFLVKAQEAKEVVSVIQGFILPVS